MAQGNDLVEHLFRTEYGKILAILTKYFGPSHIQLAEDIVQDTLIAAMDHWSTGSVPDNPTGWLVQVARRKALNEVKRNKMKLEHHASGFLDVEKEVEMDDVFLHEEIEDSQLRMIFTCCHTDIQLESRIALTLKTLCGFGSREIAQALLTSEGTINKRIYRAKQFIQQKQLLFQVPQGEELLERLEGVTLTLYLLFNQGYNSSSGDSIIQKDFCLEAMRLTKLLVTQYPDNYKLKALLALMCFHVARFEARIDHQGALIVFEDQDRSKWSAALINIGMQYFHQSIQATSLSSYHIEASIAAEHCMARNFEETNWQVIHDQYELLYQLKHNPIIKLNIAIIQSKLNGIEHSLQLLEALEESGELTAYYLLPATIGIFNMEVSNFQQALQYLESTLLLHPSPQEVSYINLKIKECKKELLLL